MADFKLVIGDSKTKRTYKAELKSPDADQLFGKKMDLERQSGASR